MYLEGAIRSIFILKPANRWLGLQHFWKYHDRLFGFTESLWSAFYAIIEPDLGSFGKILRRNNRCFQIELEDESMSINLVKLTAVCVQPKHNRVE